MWCRQVANVATHCFALREARHHHRFYIGNGTGGGRSGADDVGRCNSVGNRFAVGFGVSVFPRVKIVHALGLSNLLIGFSKPKQRGGQADGVYCNAVVADNCNVAQRDRDLASRPIAHEISRQPILETHRLYLWIDSEP